LPASGPAASLSRPKRRCVGHHLGAAGDHQVFHAGHDLTGGEAYRCDAGAAKPVEGDAADADLAEHVLGLPKSF
jgi:hypothetical protein